MEKAVEDRNECFNERCILNEMQNSPGGMSLEVVNVNSLVDPGRLSRMKTIVKQWANDVTIMVDTRVTKQKIIQMRSKDYDILATNKPFRGIAMCVHRRLDPEIAETDEENANYLAIIINANGKKIGIIGIYGPNNDDPKFYRDTLNKVLTNLVLKTDELIIAGDFNISLSDSIGYLGKSSYKKEALAECVRICNLKDVVEFKEKKCDIKPMTYIHTTKNESANKDTYPLKAARLDGIYTTIDPSGVDIMIGKFYPSDHASIRAEFPENKESRKKVWKLNVKQLQDEKLIERWKKIAGNLTEANESLREKLDSENEISAYRYNEILGKDALRRWISLYYRYYKGDGNQKLERKGGTGK